MENYKEKYEQAIENLKKIKNANRDNKELVDFIEYQYPELKESEDERVKNEIIAFVEQSIHRGGGTPIPQEQENRWLAWLEKQEPNRLEKEIELAYKTADEVQYRDGFKAGQNEILENPQKYGLEKRGKQKFTWNKEDDLNLNQAIYVCHQYQYVGVELWLKSLKQRMKGE